MQTVHLSKTDISYKKEKCSASMLNYSENQFVHKERIMYYWRDLHTRRGLRHWAMKL